MLGFGFQKGMAEELLQLSCHFGCPPKPNLKTQNLPRPLPVCPALPQTAGTAPPAALLLACCCPEDDKLCCACLIRRLVECAEAERRVILTCDTFFLQAGWAEPLSAFSAACVQSAGYSERVSCLAQAPLAQASRLHASKCLLRKAGNSVC